MDAAQQENPTPTDASPAVGLKHSDESSEAPAGSRRRKLAIVVILMMMGAVLLDAGFFAGGPTRPASSADGLDDLDGFLAEMNNTAVRTTSNDSSASNTDQPGPPDRSVHVTTTSLSKPASTESAFSLTIPDSDSNEHRPGLVADGLHTGGYGVPSRAIAPGIRLTGSIQPLP